MRSPDVIVIGGGVIGCAVARSLALGGVEVTLLERDQPGSHASWAAAGMLSPLAEAEGPGAFLSLLRQSRASFPALAAALRDETGIDVGYRGEGTLLVALREEDEPTLDARFRWQREAGLPVRRLGATETLALEPRLTDRVRGALLFPEDHQVDNRHLARALWGAAARAGAQIRTGVQVQRLLRGGGRVEGVEVIGGERIAAGTVVIAAGSWAGQIDGLPRPLPVVPVHGQLVALETLPPAFVHVVDSPRVYMVPRSDGRLILGATVEHTGFRKAVTPAGVLRILAAALEVAPSLGDAPIVESWSGLRPGTPDGLPILGPDPEVAGLVYATGHFRNGILLTPVTARIVDDLFHGRAPCCDLAPFRAERFESPES